MKKIVFFMMVIGLVGMVLTGCNNHSAEEASVDMSPVLEEYASDESVYDLQADKYVDLGLPSGTLWSNIDECEDNVDYGIFYNYGRASYKFGSNLPTKSQWEELYKECKWTWVDGEKGAFTVTGPNGNSITLYEWGVLSSDGYMSEEGSNGGYWSSSPHGSEYAWSLHMEDDWASVEYARRSVGRCVRLVREAAQHVEVRETGQYVDLGLPSGTKWSNTNESGLYTFNEAVSRFGDKLPSKEQWEELYRECKWSWVDGWLLTWEEGESAETAGYGFTGPNGKSIFLPTDEGDFGMNGSYWSSSYSGKGLAWGWGFYGDRMYMDYYSRDDRRSVRLVRD